MAAAGSSLRPSEQVDLDAQSVPSRMETQPITELLKLHTDNAIYQALRRHFHMTGKGRRPDLPVGLSVTNELLMQLYIIKEETESSFKTLKSWLEKLVPTTATVTEGRIKHRIHTVLGTVKQMLPEQRKHFLLQEINFSALAEPLAALGLNQLHLTGVDAFVQPPTIISNDVIIALEQYRAHEQESHQFIVKWIKTLSSSCISLTDKQVKTKVQSVVKQATCLKKTKQTDSLNFFLKKPFPDVLHSSNPIENVLPMQTCKECDIKAKTISILDREKKQLSSDVNALTSEVLCKSEIINDLNQLRIANETLEGKLKENKCLIKNVTAERDQLLEELGKTKRSKIYRENCELRQKIKKIEEEKCALVKDVLHCKSELNTLNSTLLTMKKKLKSEQSLKSGYKTSHHKVKQENKELKQMLTYDNDSSKIIRENGSSHRFSNNIRLAYMNLMHDAKVSAENCSKVIQIVSSHLFDTDIDIKDLPSVSSAINFSGEAHVIAKQHAAEKVLNCEHFTFACDGTSRDKRHFLEQHIILDNGKTISLGFSEIVTDNSETLLEKCVSVFKELVEIYSLDENIDQDKLLKDIIRKMKCLLSDRAAVMKLFDKKMAEYKEILLNGEDSSTHFLYCNAHFLLGLVTAVEDAVKTQEMAIKGDGQKLGRDAQTCYSRFSSSSETAAFRVLRAAADVLGPRGDEKNGCRQEWLAFCQTAGKRSYFTSFRTNRFNNIFQNASAVIYHLEDIISFLTDYVSHSNLKMQSILADLKDPIILSAIGAISFLHIHFTEPYWKLVNSDTSYADFPSFVRQMKNTLDAWSSDTFHVSSASSVFENVNFHSPLFLKSVITNFFNNDMCDISYVHLILKKIVMKCTLVFERQLCDFLEGGVFGGVLDDNVQSILRTCPLTNITGERLFGDLDYRINRSRNASLHLHTTGNMWKHNRTSQWVKRRSKGVAKRLVEKAIKYGPEFRRRSMEARKIVMEKRREKLRQNKQLKDEKCLSIAQKKSNAIDAVIHDGGIVTTKEELDEIVSGKGALEKLRNQIRFRKLCRGENIMITGNIKCLYNRLLHHISK